MTTVHEASANPDRGYLILDMHHNDNGTGTMEVLFYEDGHTLRYNLWLPDDPAKVDAEIRARWPLADFIAKKATAANVAAKIDQYKALVAKWTAVSGVVGPIATPLAPPPQTGSLGVQRPAV